MTAADRPTIDVEPAVGGWPAPWPAVAELATVLPKERWTLVGGLMVQLHTAHRGWGIVRPTGDVDIVLHIETTRGVVSQTASALGSIGNRLQETVDPRTQTAHRFVRGAASVDVLTADPEVVDVLIADHAAPTVTEKLRGRDMVRTEGGTQALRRTVNARLRNLPGEGTTISAPRPLRCARPDASHQRAPARGALRLGRRRRPRGRDPLADVLHAQTTAVRDADRRELIETAARKEIFRRVPVVFLVLPVIILFANHPRPVTRRTTPPIPAAVDR